MAYTEQQKEERRIHRYRVANPILLEQYTTIPETMLNETFDGVEHPDWSTVAGKMAYVVPGWVYGHELRVWCETHFRWNSHGRTEGNVEFRVAHCCSGFDIFHPSSIVIAVQGNSTPEMEKIMRGYIRNEKLTHTPPPAPLPRIIHVRGSRGDADFICSIGNLIAGEAVNA